MKEKIKPRSKWSGEPVICTVMKLYLLLLQTANKFVNQSINPLVFYVTVTAPPLTPLLAAAVNGTMLEMGRSRTN